MRTIFIVQPSEAETARNMEKKLLSLPEESGILFVGVEVMPDPLDISRRPLYRVFIGCSRERDPDLMHALAVNYLREFVEDERQLVLEAHCGLDRSLLTS